MLFLLVLLPLHAFASSLEEVDPIEAQHLMLSTQSLLVDIRKPLEFEQIHIPGSINVSPLTLINKNFMRPKDVILVDSGFFQKDTLSLATAAVKHGFSSVRVMRGGIAGWANDNLPLAIWGENRNAVYAVSSQEFYQLVRINKPGVLLVYLDEQSKAVEAWQGRAVHVPLSDVKGSDVVKAVLAEIEGGGADGVISTIIFVDTQGHAAETFDTIRDTLMGKGLYFYLTDGLTEYLRYAKMIHTLNLNKTASREQQCRN